MADLVVVVVIVVVRMGGQTTLESRPKFHGPTRGLIDRGESKKCNVVLWIFDGPRGIMQSQT
jgi:hypothetical protein